MIYVLPRRIFQIFLQAPEKYFQKDIFTILERYEKKLLVGNYLSKYQSL